jgi:predicted esterase
MLFPSPYTANPSAKYPLIVMLHGLGESGVRGTAGFPAYGTLDPRRLNNDHSLFHSGLSHLEASADQTFPGFIVAPQNSSQWTEDALDGVIAMIQELMENYPIDPYRIYLHGYSNGGDGVWKLAEKRPDLFAAILPMSWIYFDLSMEQVIHIPTWYFQGELDEQPLASSAQFTMTQLRAIGGTPRYTEYENAGHAIWYRAYDEPDFFSWMLGKTKTDIMAYFGRTSVCQGEEVNIRLGVSPGFASYQWRKTTSQGTETFSVGGQDNNELIATTTGEYQVRVSRSATPGGSSWSPWSKPISISVEDNFAPPVITLDGSPHLPSPDGRQSALLSVPDTFAFYQWYRNGNIIPQATNPVYTATQAGTYYVNVSPVETCPPVSSTTVQITVNGTTPAVGSPSNLNASTVSEVALELTWADNSSNEDGFELYRARASNGPYTLVYDIPQNTTIKKDSSLIPGTTYFYRIRAYNTTGVSAMSNTASGTTLTDVTPPTTPGFLTYELKDPSTIVLSWGPSSDNSDVIIYEIIVNGVVVGTTEELTYTLSGLAQESLYNIVIRARDRAGNRSDNSNQVSVRTVFEGVSYRYYYGGLWAQVDDYLGWPIEKQGYLDNITIATESDGGVRPDIQVNYFAFDFEGFLYINTPGTYIFSLEAAAGSILQVGNLTINNDGQHPAQTEIGNVVLPAGPVPFLVRMYDRTEDEILVIKYSGPDTGNQLVTISDDALTSSKKVFPDPPQAPTEFKTDTVALTDLTLTWQDESNNETGFEVLRSRSENGPYAKLVTTSPNTSLFDDSALAPLTTYYYLVRAIGSTGTSDFDSLSTTTALPLAFLEGECSNEGNVLSWSRNLRLSEEPFLVERSSDMVNYSTIGRLLTDTTGTVYSWTDNLFESDTTYYRIRQQSTGGGYGSSQSITSICSPVGFKLKADIYPVPLTNGILTIRMRSMLPNQPVGITLIDNVGRIHFQKEFSSNPESSPYYIDLSGIAQKGLYIVFITQGGATYQQKIIIDNQ